MITALIVAGGQGTRMGRDKLFIELCGKPVLAHTWGRFDGCSIVDEIILVTREGMESELELLAGRYAFGKPFKIVRGGKERQDSVWNGLEALSAEAQIVAIQDAARPCTTSRMIEETVAAAREHGAAVVAQPMVDTIKESADGQFVRQTLDRSRLWSVQTPQVFRVSVIRRALTAVREKGINVTDDTAACELIRQPVRLVPTSEPNPKVTRPEDVTYIEWLLQNSDRSSSLR